MTDLATRLEEAAQAACHEEQMIVWSGEVVGALGMGDFLREGMSYDEGLDLVATVEREIKRIVSSAFSHPEAISALKSSGEMGWMSIETAPKDGNTEIIGMNARGHVHKTWFFAPSSRTQQWVRSYDNVPWQPTHWMPLPASPSSMKEKGNE